MDLPRARGAGADGPLDVDRVAEGPLDALAQRRELEDLVVAQAGSGPGRGVEGDALDGGR